MQFSKTNLLIITNFFLLNIILVHFVLFHFSFLFSFLYLSSVFDVFALVKEIQWVLLSLTHGCINFLLQNVSQYWRLSKKHNHHNHIKSEHYAQMLLYCFDWMTLYFGSPTLHLRFMPNKQKINWIQLSQNNRNVLSINGIDLWMFLLIDDWNFYNHFYILLQNRLCKSLK